MSDDHDDVKGPREVRYRLLCPTRRGRWKDGQETSSGESWPGGTRCTLPIVFSTWGQASNVHVLEYLERESGLACEACYGRGGLRNAETPRQPFRVQAWSRCRARLGRLRKGCLSTWRRTGTTPRQAQLRTCPWTDQIRPSQRRGI